MTKPCPPFCGEIRSIFQLAGYIRQRVRNFASSTTSLPLLVVGISMQRPTCTNIRIRSTCDAHKIFFAVHLGTLPMISKRLDIEERMALRSGCVYAWEERGPNTEVTGLGIERFTEGRRWSPSRVRDVMHSSPLVPLTLLMKRSRNFYFIMKSTHLRKMLLVTGLFSHFLCKPRLHVMLE
jgi:hypothetical protein